MRRNSLLAGLVALGLQALSTGAVSPNAFEDGGTTPVSALMMFLGNEHSVYILDKAEANAAQVKGHPAWGAVWDIQQRTAVVQDIRTNSFCASGMHLPNGSFVTFGGNDAVGPAQAHGSTKNPDGQTGAWDSTYQDFDGRKAIRVIKPCTIADDLNNGDCAWFDDPTVLGMKRFRWYSAVEPTGDGEIVIIGGFVTGGYINRNLPNVDPTTSNGQAEPTFEFFPARDGEPQNLDFMTQTSGLNAYAHTYLMPSGRMFLQANLSTVLWDFNANQETPLPPMPNGVIRVYPASGATAMLPLTPKNNYEPTMIFCGGSDMQDEWWGDYGRPRHDTWTYPASKDCQRITPEPQDGSEPVYVQDDDMPGVGRTMGQFIALPTGKYLLLNGGQFGTAGYSASGTPDTPVDQMPFGVSLAAGPVLTPAYYDPTAPQGQRWSQDNLTASKIPRLYHSTAVLLPDGSVLVAGSNPNPDVDLQTLFPTEYRAEVFFPYYFSAPLRPSPQNIPTTLTYGGDYFNITIPSSSYNGSANDAADSATVVLVRGGFSTHAMQMGQRFLQLNNTYTVNKDSSITLHVSQLPQNPNLFQPGPALLFVNIHEVPSNSTYVIVGNGVVGKQPTSPPSPLPDSVRLDNVQGGSNGSSGGTNTPTGNGNDSEKSTSKVPLIAGIAGGAALLLAIAAIAIVMVRRRNAASRGTNTAKFERIDLAGGPPQHTVPWGHGHNGSDVALVPPTKGPYGEGEWRTSSPALGGPFYGAYKDDVPGQGFRDSMHSATSSMVDPYMRTPQEPYDPYSNVNVGSSSNLDPHPNTTYQPPSHSSPQTHPSF
ncbi:copper radical oxidase [Panaeolus papilionaceus]|nr:copper radical oxidase [Panaeolus papilionaceus]